MKGNNYSTKEKKAVLRSIKSDCKKKQNTNKYLKETKSVLMSASPYPPAL